MFLHRVLLSLYTELALLADFKEVVKKSSSGKIRRQYQPNKAIRFVHTFALKELNKVLQRAGVTFPSATGWEKGSSIRNNLKRHVNKNYFFNNFWYVVDISGAYGKVHVELLAAILQAFYPQVSLYEITTYLEKFFFIPRRKDNKLAYLSSTSGLAEGFPASPKLFNLYAEYMVDADLRTFCANLGITYTRFGDDIAFSSDVRIGKRTKKKLLSMIRLGFVAPHLINEKKIKSFCLGDYGDRGVEVNGVGIRNTTQAELFMPKCQRDTLKALLHKSLTEDSVRPQVIEGHMAVFTASLFGFRTTMKRKTNAEKKILLMYRKWRNMRKLIVFLQVALVGVPLHEKKLVELESTFFYYRSKLKAKRDREVLGLLWEISFIRKKPSKFQEEYKSIVPVEKVK